MPTTHTFTTHITAQLDAGFSDDLLVEVTFTTTKADFGVTQSPSWNEIDITSVVFESGLPLPEPDFATWHDFLAEKCQEYLDKIGENQ